MKTLVSKKGSQEVTVERRDGCVVIRSHETKTHRNFSVTVFDELLAGLIAQLSAIAITRSPTLRAPANADGAYCMCEKPLDDDGWRCICCGKLLSPRHGG